MKGVPKLGILVTNKPLKTTSTIDKDIMLNNSPMKFNVPGKLVVPRINRNNEVENTGYPVIMDNQVYYDLSSPIITAESLINSSPVK